MSTLTAKEALEEIEKNGELQEFIIVGSLPDGDIICGVRIPTNIEEGEETFKAMLMAATASGIKALEFAEDNQDKEEHATNIFQ